MAEATVNYFRVCMRHLRYATAQSDGIGRRYLRDSRHVCITGSEQAVSSGGCRASAMIVWR